MSKPVDESEYQAALIEAVRWVKALIKFTNALEGTAHGVHAPSEDVNPTLKEVYLLEFFPKDGSRFFAGAFESKAAAEAWLGEPILLSEGFVAKTPVLQELTIPYGTWRLRKCKVQKLNGRQP